MNFLRISLFILFFFFSNAICFADGQTVQQDWPQHLRILAGPPGGQWFLVSEPMSKILSREVVPSSYHQGGGVSNLERINKGQGDLGFSLTSFLSGATSGAPEYRDIKTENVRFIGNVYPQVLYFLVRNEFAQQHNIKSVDDLIQLKTPVRLALLKKGTGSEFFVRILLRYGYDTSYEKLREKGWKILFNNYPETADDFVEGELDCFAYTAGTRVPLLLDIETYTKFTVLPITDTVLHRLREKFKFNVYTIAPATYKSVTQPVKTLNDFSCLIVRKDLDKTLVQSILASLWKHRNDLSNTLVEFQNFSREQAVSEGVPIHPGAKEFWTMARE